MLIPQYSPRHFRRLGIWHLSGWAIKAYAIAVEAPRHGPLPDPRMIDEARTYVEANLARMNDTAHYSTGFVILHHGSGAKSLLTQWWANECVCLQHVAQSAYVGRPALSRRRTI